MMHLSKDDLRLVIKILRRRWRRYGPTHSDATVLYRFMRDLEHSYLPAHLFRAFGSSLEQEEWSPSIAAFLLRIYIPDIWGLRDVKFPPAFIPGSILEQIWLSSKSTDESRILDLDPALIVYVPPAYRGAALTNTWARTKYLAKHYLSALG